MSGNWKYFLLKSAGRHGATPNWSHLCNNPEHFDDQRESEESEVSPVAGLAWAASPNRFPSPSSHLPTGTKSVEIWRVLTDLSRDISEMYAGLWLGLITLSVSDLINTAEPHLHPPPPGGSQYNQIPDTTEMTGPGGPLVSHRDIRVMLSSVSPHATSLTLTLHFTFQSIMTGILGFWGGVFLMGLLFLLMVLAKRVFKPEEADKSPAWLSNDYVQDFLMEIIFIFKIK